MHKHRSVVGWWCRLFLLLCWVPLVTPQAYAGAAQRLRASKQPVPENTARGDAAVDTYKQGRLKLDYGDGAEEAGSVPPQHAGIVPPQERARGSRPVQHDSEVAGKRQSWQRNWTHYHARADANSNHRERPMNPAYQWGSDANPKTPHDEEAKGNFDWDPDTDPDQPNPMTEEQRLSAFHEERKTLPTNQHKEALLKLKGQEWDSCEKVDGREVPISEQYPLAYAVTAHHHYIDHCENFCSALLDQTCSKACDSSGGCYCDGKYDFKISNCFKKMPTKVCLCAETKKLDRGMGVHEPFDINKVRHPYHHIDPKGHDDRVNATHHVKPQAGDFRKRPRHHIERERAKEQGTEEEHEKSKQRRHEERREKLRLHEEKLAKISAKHAQASEKAAGTTDERIQAAAEAAKRLKKAPPTLMSVEDMIQMAKDEYQDFLHEDL